MVIHAEHVSRFVLLSIKRYSVQTSIFTIARRRMVSVITPHHAKALQVEVAIAVREYHETLANMDRLTEGLFFVGSTKE